MRTVPFIKSKLNTREMIVFIIIIASAIFFIFYRLGSADSLTDGSHYSLRALGYTDYIVPRLQSTPLEWFEKIPSWSKLSFHDAPPLVFIIENISFKIFGENMYGMRLPFALAGLGTLFITYYITKKLFDKKTALISMAVLASSTFFIWSSRTAYLEGVEVFFIMLAAYLFLLSLDDDNFFIWFGVVMGLAFLCKYTSIYLFGAIILYFGIKERKYFLNKKFLFGTFLFFVVISPVIYYNAMVFVTRGHLDAQLSHLFPNMLSVSQRDWPGLYDGNAPGFHPLDNFNNIWSALRTGFSLPFFIFLVIASIYIFITATLPKKGNNYFFLSITMLSAMAMFLVIPPTVRYLPIVVPFLGISAGVFLMKAKEVFEKKNKKYIFITLVVALFGIEIFFNFITNNAAPMGNTSSFWYSNIGEKNFGYNQLEAFLKTTWENESFYSKDVKTIRYVHDVRLDWYSLQGYNFYLFDFDLDWFARIWYFNRQFNYHSVPFLGDSEFINELARSKIPREAFIDFLKDMGIRNLYYIVGVNDFVHSSGYASKTAERELTQYIQERFRTVMAEGGEGEITPIINDRGEKAFQVYRIKIQ